ncbi:glucose-1-phosphate cytidylyltransferase [Methanospirillum lacunae]|uniref:Glucose-1-phosphate cytidylyltransferase n=1 Tax=Methanospirillum lacunae TaxID=668570 RepID=A0A2V2MZ64_9EURY|nr:glucose-1-phosphate cytidylyltransferase [Methanospirillum lacunae]PWR70706.1 glucose-1-phosphate cytidylyltransferase [Methanospirillum lacunae]
MQVVILCGGLGTRLKEETEFRPKPMVPIGGRPILWHIMQLYSRFGHQEFILALGYKGDQIKEYFYHYELMNSDVSIEFGAESKMTFYPRHDEVAGWKVTLVDTGELSLKGARIKRIEKFVHDDLFLMTYGDGLSDLNLDQLITFHQSHGKMVTLTGVSPASQFGEMKIIGDQIVKFKEKPEVSTHYVNGGYYICNRKIFDYLTLDDLCDFETGLLELLAEKGELMIYRHSGKWACMDTLRDVQYLNHLWAENKAFWKVPPQ